MGNATGMGERGRDNLLRRGAELGIAVIEPAGKVLVRAAAERRNDDPNDRQEGREACGHNPQPELPVALCQEDIRAEPDANERQLLLDQEGGEEAEEKPCWPALLQEVDRES